MILAGLATLTVGAELLVRGASGLARAIGLPALIIGLTVVAYGTSAPEFAVSMQAGLVGQADIALGNVVGSNIFNVLFILGVSALILPLAVSSQLVRFDVPVMIGTSVLAWFVSANGSITRFEGAILAMGIVTYTVILVHMGKKSRLSSESFKESANTSTPGGKPVISVVLVFLGLGLLLLGAQWLVGGATGLAKALGVSELLIGLTIVAAGTSLPELATSVVAAIRGERDIAVGNVVGSNIFNILAVLGSSATVSGKVGVAPGALHFDIPVMTAVALACLPIFFTGGRISRWEGALFLGYYIAYVSYLILAASHHEAAKAFTSAVLWFAVPATALGISVSLFQTLRVRKIHNDDTRRT